MFKLKPVLNYLGRTETLLDARAVARCNVSTVGGGETEQLPSNFTTPMIVTPGLDRVDPYLARVSNTSALLFYRNINNATKLYYKLISLVAPILSQEAEVELLGTTDINIAAVGCVGLTDDKVLLVYKLSTSDDVWVCVANVTAPTVTFTSPVSIGTTHFPDYERSFLDVQKIDSSNVIISSPTSDAAHTVQCQVVTIGVADAITYGTPAIPALTGVACPKVSVSTTSLGFLAVADYANGAAGGYQSTVGSFAISGQSITFNTASRYFNSSQYNITSDPDNNRRFHLWGIATMTSTKAMVFGGGYVYRSASDKDMGFSALDITDTAGVTTSTTAFIDEDSVVYSGVPARFSLANCVSHNSKMVAMVTVTDISPMSVNLVSYSGTTTPAVSDYYQIESTGVDYLYPPDITSLEHENYLVGGYTYRSGSSYKIKVFAVAIV